MMIRGNRLHLIGNGSRGGSFALRALLMACFAMLIICMGFLAKQSARVEAAPADSENQASGYLGQAKRFLDSGTHLKLPTSFKQQQQTKSSSSTSSSSSSTSSPDVYVPLVSASTDIDPQLEQQLRQSIKLATDLINNYRQNGLASLPSLPNLPGVGTVMRLPDKLLRAELSMIQDEIKMAMEMMNNPLAATMNAPRDIASMFSRMAEQLEQ